MLFSALFRKNIRSLNDPDLLSLVRKGNRNADGELFKRYAVLVMGVCLKYLKNQMVAEDMVMTIFEKLPEKIRKNEIQNFKSWLYSVSRNECLMELRKTKRLTADFETALLASEDQSAIQLQEVFAKNEKLDLLEKALSELKEDQQKALRLFYLESNSYDEISVKMDAPVKRIKSLIQNGRRNLKLKLTKK